MKKHILPLLLLIVLTYWTVKPLLGSGYFSMHDDTQVGRVIVMGKALRNGQFPVRWVSELGYGYGYPLYNFYGPLPYYIGGGLYAAGVDGVTATKFMMGLGMVIAAIGMYMFVSGLLGRSAGLLAGILYAYAPYHAVELYVRGAVGELWAYASLPVFFWGLFTIADPKARTKGVWIGGLGLAGIILSHTITGYVTVVFYGAGLVLYSLILLFKNRFHSSLITHHTSTSLSASFSLLFVGLGLSAFFWLPAIFEMSYTNIAGQIGDSANFRDHFVCLPQLWNSLWGYGGSVLGCIDGMSFKIGKLHVIFGTLGLGLLYWRLKRTFWSYPLGIVSIIGIVSVWMATSYSQILWELFPGFAYIQYPWRFLTGIVFAVSVLGGGVVYRIRKKWSKAIILFSLVIAIPGVNAKLFVPQKAYDIAATNFESVEELSWRVSKVSDEYLPPSFHAPQAPQTVAREILATDVNRGVRVETEINTETYAKLFVQTQNPLDATLQRTYFPGWQYWVNGVRQTQRVENGLPVLRMPTGTNVVELRFGNTPVRFIGNILSIGVLLWFLIKYGKTSIA